MSKPDSIATTNATPSAAPRTDRAPARRPGARRISEGIIAGYLHNISQRHRPTTHGRKPRLLGTASR
jgi:hypothetical protein